MNLGGPVWHASVAAYPRGSLSPKKLRKLALSLLKDVGDAAKQWHEWTGVAWHVRRRLTPAEQEKVGPVLDCRGTEEWSKRFLAARAYLPEAALRMAREEAYS